ncbi:MAG TPA: MG2 domain-containing protein [Polyangia bacterium]
MVASAMAAGCGPKVKPGLGVTGDKTVAKFDRAMVGDDKLGFDVSDPPVRMQPSVPGRFRWLDARTLTFLPDEPLPRSTRFEMEARAGTRARDGFGLEKAVRWSFETERLHVTIGAPGRWATPDQRVTLSFNQPVRRRDVEKRCAYLSDARSVAAVVDNTGENEDARQRFNVLPHEPLALATSWRLECGAELTGAEGPLGLDAGAAAALFETYGPMKVVSVKPQGAEISPDESSLVITFSNPLAVTAAALPIKVQPAIEGFPERAAVVEDHVSYSVRALQPNTRYVVTVDAAVADRFGQRLAGPFVAEFGTGDGTPRLDVETGAWVVEASRPGYPAWSRNLTKIEADITPVPEAKLGQLAGQLDWWDAEVLDATKVGLKTRHVTIPINGRKNQWDQIQIEPAKLLGSAAPPLGFYYLALRAPDEPHPDADAPQPRELLLNFTNLGVTAKLSGPSGLVWVTRLWDGQPQPGAEVSIRDSKGKVRWRGTTDAQGLAVTPGQAQLLPKEKRDQRNRAAADDAGGDGEGGGGDGEGDGEGDFAGPRSADLLIFARLGKDTTWVNPERTGGLAAWNFHVSVDASARAEQLRGFLHTDRGLYRPGDTVRVKGLARVMKLGSALRVPASRKAHVVVRDPRGEQLLEKNVPLSRFGGFAVDVPIGEGARVGDYRVEASLAEGTFHERFSVEQYRAASFEVKVPQPAREPVAGEELKLTAEARYLYGAPLRGGSITWRVHRRSRELSFPKLPGYDFSDARQWRNWWDARSGASEPLVEENEQRLDRNGRGKLSLTLKKDDFQTAQDIMVTAEVQDETHQTIAANVAIPAHQAGVYFGIDRGSPIGEAKGPRTIKVVAVDPKGNRIAAGGTFKIIRHDWSCAWEAWGYRGSYRCEAHDGEVMRQAVAVGAEAPAEIKFAPPGSGEYELIVEGKDGAGNATAAASTFYSWGGDEGSWQANDDERFELIADKPSYKVGETARLLLKTTVRNATGLLTIERDGVLEKRLFTAGAGTSTVEVPIKEGYGPNVYASVMLVKGRTGKGGRGVPIIRMGMTTLAVDTAAKRLKVEVATDKPSYRPGETVTADLKVTDTAGKPVQAEVALSAADEGVLTLIAFKTPDPLATFYAAWGLGVTTASQYDRIAHLPEPGEDRYATGGDGAGEPGTFRSRFLATAYWNPRIETDADGHARVTFQAPDNLTAYRLMAVAADAGERFGSGDKRMTVRKPLQLLTAMPRFMNVGDEAKAGVLVVNDTGKAGNVVVDATVSGARLRGGAHQEAAVPANGRLPMLFPLRAERAGELKLRVKAVLGDETDGIELKIPVHYPARVEAELVAEGHTTGAAEIPVKLPAGIMPASASLEVSTDPDGVAGLEEGLRDLIEYPYGCLEQTTSRLIPLVAVEELARSLKLQGLDGPALQKYIRAGLGKLEKFQTDEGGFSLWMGGQAEPYLTAFALWGLKLASDAGHKLPPGMIDRGAAYLRAQLGRDSTVAGGVHSELGEMGSRAFAVHVLAMLNKPDPGYATKLLEKKAELPRFGEAFLARALALNLGAQDPAVTGLLDDLTRAAETSGATAMIREPSRDHLWWYMSSDARTTAIATDAFLDLRPSEPMLPKLVKGLFGERRTGRWNTTQDNLYALVALTHYVKTRPLGAVTVDATLGDRKVLAGDFRGKTSHIRRASVALDASKPPAAPLTIRASGGEVFYSTVLRFRRDVAHQKPYENQMTVRREYLDATTDAPIDAKKGVKVGSMVRVRVTLSSPELRNHLVIDDPLPAGLEPLNTKLVTSGGAPKKETRRGRGEPRDLDAWWNPSFRETRDDRVLVFVDNLQPGPVSFDYLARATTVGTFVVPGTSAEEMYQPEIAARTAPGTFVVRE